MDWPLFALITYGFLLALIIVLIILRSRRAVRSQYARVLEEKETKLARMQVDLEESMEALDAYAEQLRLEWRKIQKDDQESLSRLYKKEIDIEASLLTLRARVTAIEVERKREKSAQPTQYQPIAAHAIEPRAAKEAAPQAAPDVLRMSAPQAAQDVLRMSAPQAIREPSDAAAFTPDYAPIAHANPHAMQFRASSPMAREQPQAAQTPPPAQSAPPITQSAPPITQSAPPITQSAPSAMQSAPPAMQSAPLITQTPPTAQSTSPITQSAPPAMQSAPPITQSAPPEGKDATPAAQSEAPMEDCADEGGDVQRRAQALYEAGEDAAAISQRLNISHTETSLLLKSLFLTKAREQTDSSMREAIEALKKGEKPAEVARRFDLSHTEVALLAASKAHAAPAVK